MFVQNHGVIIKHLPALEVNKGLFLTSSGKTLGPLCREVGNTGTRAAVREPGTFSRLSGKEAGGIFMPDSCGDLRPGMGRGSLQTLLTPTVALCSHVHGWPRVRRVGPGVGVKCHRDVTAGCGPAVTRSSCAAQSGPRALMGRSLTVTVSETQLGHKALGLSHWWVQLCMRAEHGSGHWAGVAPHLRVDQRQGPGSQGAAPSRAPV